MVELPIVMNHVEVRAGDRKLLENVSLAVDKGSRVLLKGENGSGKSTFLKAITGLSLFAGEILIYGQLIIQNREAAVGHIGYVSDEVPLHEHLTGTDNLRVHALLHGIDDDDRIYSELERFGINPADDTKVQYYSTGMRQKLKIAMALFHQPSILILDEPLNGLDRKAQESVVDIIRRYDGTIMASSHWNETFIELFDRFLAIESGRLNEIV
ncbi:ABC transporter ATP-binding protein [Bacillus licheniformis]|uniref:ABC transporter ATP-binding protein n=1 Tax=Bacillus licheniformis TaxID=1402 RepID=UPI002ED95A56